MEFRLFGEVQLQAGGRLLDVGTPRQQAVLAALAVDAGRPVSIETLVDRVWHDVPPAEARNVLYSHLSRIRQLLKRIEGVTIDRRTAGYVLDVDPDRVDLHRFTRLVKQGVDPVRPAEERAERLSEALRLWRGTPLAGVPGAWAAQVRDTWSWRRLEAAVRWGTLQLELGHGDAVLAILPDLIAEHPFAEPLEVLFLRALHAAGRDAEALDHYAAVQHRLAEELGSDPGPELRALHAAILRSELPAPGPPSPLAAPAQLPPDVFGFAGRDEELRRLDGIVANGSRIVVVSGTAGVGKTALAVHWAHQVRDGFADGQLYVNLRGFDPGESPVAPAEAVRRFLDAFEVPPERIPHGIEAQIGLYRSLLADKQVLVVLDNARDAEQVRPLLPGSPGCLAVVTSRNRLSGLIAGGAQPLPLDLLPVDEAREFLVHRLGADRVAAEPHAVNEIITSCARLPLALAIVAARAVSHPRFTLTSLAGELRAFRGTLDTFAGADPVTDARAVFSWSYHQLAAAAARLFRMLGTHPGPDIAVPAAASLAGLTSDEVRPLLIELSDAHLVTEHTPGRYTFHDLLRAYAGEQTHIVDPADQRHAAIRRLSDHYLHTAHTAAQLLQPARDPLALTPPGPDVRPERPADARQALTWFTAEHAVLLAIIEHTARTGSDTYTWQLAHTLSDFFEWRGHWTDAVDTLHAALEAARRLADPGKQAAGHRLLVRPYFHLNRLTEARTHLDHALNLCRQCDDQVEQAHTLTALAFILDRQGQLREAHEHTEQALELYRAAGHRYGLARTLNNLGWSHAQLGDHQQTLVLCQQAINQYRELGSRPGEALTWDSLGYAHLHLGNQSEALACYRRALAISGDLGNRSLEANILIHLGDAHNFVGDPESANAAWQQGLAILDQLNQPEAERIRAKIRHTLSGQRGHFLDPSERNAVP